MGSIQHDFASHTSFFVQGGSRSLDPFFFKYNSSRSRGKLPGLNSAVPVFSYIKTNTAAKKRPPSTRLVEDDVTTMDLLPFSAHILTTWISENVCSLYCLFLPVRSCRG